MQDGTDCPGTLNEISNDFKLSNLIRKNSKKLDPKPLAFSLSLFYFKCVHLTKTLPSFGLDRCSLMFLIQ